MLLLITVMIRTYMKAVGELERRGWIVETFNIELRELNSPLNVER